LGFVVNGRDITERKQVEEALRESEEKFRLLSEQSLMGIIIAQDNIFKYVNQSTSDILEYSIDEIMAWEPKEYQRIVHKDDLVFVMEQAQKKQSGEKDVVISYEWRVITKTGKVKWVRTHSKTVVYKGKIADMVVLVDITERQQANEALRESEEKYRVLVETSPEPIFTITREGVYEFLNTTAAEMLGGAPSDYIGKTMWDLFPKEIADDQMGEIYQALDTGRHVSSIRKSIVGGHKMWFSAEIQPIQDYKKQYVKALVILTDITERTRLDKLNGVILRITKATNMTRDLPELLKTTRTYLHEVIDTTNFYVGLYDGSTDTITEIYSEDEYDKFTSYPAGKTRTAYVIKIGKSLFADEEVIAQLEKAGKIESFGTRSELWLGVPLRVKDEVIGALAVQSYTDTNLYTEKDLEILEHVSNEIATAIERIKSEEELRQAEQKLRLHIDNTPLAVIEWDLDFKVASWNMAAQKIFGYTFEEAQGRYAAGLIVLESARAHVDQVWQEILEMKGGQRSLNENVTKAGDIIACDWYNTPLVDDNDNVIGVASLVLDLTDQKKLEEQLRHAQKMEAIGQLAGGVAHDFNNKLGGIIGFAELALGSLDDRVALADYLNKIIDRSDKSARLVRQLLAFSRQQILDLKKVDLNRLIMEASRFLTQVIGEHIDLQLELTGEEQIINADPNAIDQIITNLCINARDAMPNGGNLILKTEKAVLDDDFCARSQWMIPGEYILFTITDSGHGMPEDMIQHIFDPFYTTKGVGEGTGLGLSMVFGLVKQHNGYIDCKSEINKGTTFVIYFPVVANNEIAADTVAEESTVFSGSEQILFAEDDEVLLEVIQTSLVDLGYTVLPARNGEDAFKIFKVNSSKIDLVISDVIMPDIGGADLHQMVRAINPEVKFLFISGYTSKNTLSVLPSDAATGILNKPFKRLVLAEKIRKLLN